MTCTNITTLTPRFQRRLDLYQNCGFFSEDTNAFSCTRAVSSELLFLAYRLVYSTFLKKKYITANTSRLRIRPFEASCKTATFVANDDKDVIGVFSVIPDSNDLTLPSDSVFKEEIDAIRSDDKLICELSSQAIVESFRNSAVPSELMRCAFAHADLINCTDLICAVTPTIGKFFEFIGFERISAVKNYSKTIEDRVVLMRLSDIQNRWSKKNAQSDATVAFWRNFFIESNPYFGQVHIWDDSAQEAWKDTTALANVFGKCKELFMTTSAETLNALRSRLGEAFYPAYKMATTKPVYRRISRVPAPSMQRGTYNTRTIAKLPRVSWHSNAPTQTRPSAMPQTSADYAYSNTTGN